jgi:hypothetical protein
MLLKDLWLADVEDRRLENNIHNRERIRQQKIHSLASIEE